MSLREVKDIAADLGMVGRAVRCELNELSDLKTPAVLHWGFSHFVVLDRVKGQRARTRDSAVSLLHLSIDEVSRKFTGVALELTPAAEFVKLKERSPLSLSIAHTVDLRTCNSFLHSTGNRPSGAEV